MAYEALHMMHGRKNGKTGSLALKLDVSKAYDKMEWNFLRQIMLKLGFPRVWVDKVMSCVSSTSFSILINGKPFGMINPTRGLQQGDLLSPYLFLLCAKGFTSLLQKAKLEGNIHGVSICRRAPKISHLLFVDDSLLFCQASKRETQETLEVLKLYAEASGQCLNMEKSSVYFNSNTSPQKRELIKAMLGVSEVDRFEYLGLPTLVG